MPTVRTVVRFRPLLEKELEKDVIVRADRVDEGKPLTLVRIPSPKNGAEEFSFAFNSVYEQSTSQEELFTAEGRYQNASCGVQSVTNFHQWLRT